MKIKLLTLIIFCFVIKVSRAQTFNCYVANDTILSPTEYKFDVYIEATSADFYFRSIQFGFSFDSQFFDPASTVFGSVIPNSTQLLSYVVGAPQWNSTYFCLTIPSSTMTNCVTAPNTNSNSLLTVGQPIRISSYKLTSSIPFKCKKPNISMIRPTDIAPAVGILKMSVSSWNSTCMAVSISGNGTYSNYGANSLYSILNNPLDTLCNVGINEINGSFTISPNPTSGVIKISSSKNIEGEIKVYDYKGAIVKEFENNNHSGTIILDVTSLPCGIYFLKVGNSNTKFVRSE